MSAYEDAKLFIGVVQTPELNDKRKAAFPKCPVGEHAVAGIADAPRPEHGMPR